VRTRPPVAVAALAAGLFLLTACGGDDDDTATASSGTGGGAAASAPASAAAGPDSSVPSPDAAQRARILDVLRGIDPEAAADEDRAIARARSTCQDILAGKDGTALAADTATRFTQGGALVDPVDAARVVTVIKETFCKG
jgi:hypothetical protein